MDWQDPSPLLGVVTTVPPAGVGGGAERLLAKHSMLRAQNEVRLGWDGRALFCRDYRPHPASPAPEGVQGFANLGLQAPLHWHQQQRHPGCGQGEGRYSPWKYTPEQTFSTLGRDAMSRDKMYCWKERGSMAPHPPCGSAGIRV